MPFITKVVITTGGGGTITDLGDYDANDNNIIDEAETLTDGVNSVNVGDIIDLDLTKLDKDGPIDGGGFQP